ncbi:hypothetical protein [Streptomyces sp. NPDC092307]|uniref:hypothetical protein n=1 Tax=Streptomyces sp. NPDC092307 TaxID=3366013 RepID=UPI0038304A72
MLQRIRSGSEEEFRALSQRVRSGRDPTYALARTGTESLDAFRGRLLYLARAVLVLRYTCG